ncbi:hypothetical protein CC86DRAFT_349788 [Ophiobolus disseminans]|uniref:Thymidylate kinase n=1 Tax=Ophiobolus disseminans TaxID=1469910 RepID=A0A6A7A097_9PLEO|nr:hypothetical protein CC86DRAFT_349788 [Ophiobolus disseminans]
MASVTRQVFGEIGDSRLQTLQSAKNRQNAIISSFASPMKPTTTPSTGKRQRAPEIFEDVDSENMDPSVFASPTKKSKTSSTLDFDFVKPSKFNLVSTPVKSVSLNATPSVISTRKILTPSSTAKSTPINKSRGSPKHNRIAAISKRRASSSPFRRVDPPSFSQGSPSLPFSIDAALSGTISGYTPKASVASKPATAPVQAPAASTLEDSMPKGWFFEIHEDTPEQEAANLMEHSASVLDISSDDDAITKQHNDEQERGKENIPPPNFLLSQPRVHLPTEESLEGPKVEEPAKRPRLRKFVQDAMEEDRRPLGDLVASDFYAEGCDASSYVTVDAGIERPSSLSKECDFSFPSPEKVVEEIVKEVVDTENIAPAVEAASDTASS